MFDLNPSDAAPRQLDIFIKDQPHAPRGVDRCLARRSRDYDDGAEKTEKREKNDKKWKREKKNNEKNKWYHGSERASNDRSTPINRAGSTVVFNLYFRFLYNTHTIEPKRKSRL